MSGNRRGYPIRGVRRDPERVEVDRLLRTVPISGNRILDVGCGDGRLTRRIAGTAAWVVGADPDLERIGHAVRLTPLRSRSTMRFVVADAERLPFPASSFPVAILSWSL